MKYFENIQSLDQLKELYRRYVIAMHPDRGGSETEFQEMQAEFERAALLFSDSKQSRAAADAAKKAEEERRRRDEERRQEEEEARRYQEEERRRREQEAKEEAERIEKERAAIRPFIAKWAKKLEQVPEYDRYSPSASYRAALVRNIKKILAHYFPGVAFKVSLSWQTWKENAEISWTDGPSIEEVENVEELDLFINKSWVSDPYADYGHAESRKSVDEWCSQFGSVPDLRWGYKRYFSDIAKNHIYNKIWEGFPDVAGKTDGDVMIFVESLYDVSVASNTFSKLFGLDIHKMRKNASFSWDNDIKMDFSRAFDVLKALYVVPAEYDANKQEKDDAPKFVPVLGPKLKALKKALGANVFAYVGKGGEWKDSHRLDVAEVLERIANGENVYLAKPFTNSEGKVCYLSISWVSWAADEKRRKKFDAVGISLNRYCHVTAIDPDFAAAYRAELADIEEQRREWEKKQAESKKTARQKSTTKTEEETTSDTTTEQPQESPAADSSDSEEAAPADGLSLVDIPGGVAVVGSSRDTFKNRKAIKAHGAAWNKEAQQWQATAPEDVARLRAWFGSVESEQPEEEPQEKTQEQPQPQEQPQEQPQKQQEEQSQADASSDVRISIEDLFCYEIMVLFDAFRNTMAIASKNWQELQQSQQPKAGDSDTVEVEAREMVEEWRKRIEGGNIDTVCKTLGEICAFLAHLSPDLANVFNFYGMGFYSGDFRANLRAHVAALRAFLTSLGSKSATYAALLEGVAA